MYHDEIVLNMKKRVLIVFGTRPEAIKMAPVVKSFLSDAEHFETKVCVTAQHREMLDQVLNFFKIVPDYDLDLMKPNQTLNQLGANILIHIDPVLAEFKPHLVLVHGDTTTSSMVALAAFHRQIKVGHVEAGLRTYNKWAPFPEEINRQLTGRIADYHFSPTTKSASNLYIKEGIEQSKVYVTGNTVIDALLWGIKNVNDQRDDILKIKRFLKPNKKLIVVTGHRRENFGEKFEQFCKALLKIGSRDDVLMIYPVHLNPNVQQVVKKYLSDTASILLIDPLDYEAFIWLLSQSHIIITDSGGIQEEAPSLGKPVLVTRDVTERQEAIEEGTVKLVGTDTEEIINSCLNLLDNQELYATMKVKNNPYGDGSAALKILKTVKNIFNLDK